MNMHQVIGVAVWLAASAGALLLVRTDLGVTAAPAQMVAQEFHVAAAETSRLRSICVVSGQRVRAGDVLARLDTGVLEREIAAGEARLRQANAEPAAVEAQLESDGYETERRFEADVTATQGEIESAKMSRGLQEAELASIRQEVTRQRGLVREGLARTERADELEVRARTLSEALAVWPARIDALTNRRDAAERRLAEWRNRHRLATAPDARTARLQPLKESAAEQQENLRALRARLAAATILAPADGEVVSILARPGDVAVGGVPFVVLHGGGVRALVAYVGERARLGPGVNAVVRRRTAPYEEWRTKVQRASEPVVQLPPRFWQVPTVPQWGREVYLEVPQSARIDAGEALDVRFLSNGDGL